MEFIHEILGYEVTPADLVEGVSEDGHEDSLADREQVLEDGLVELHEHDIFGNAVREGLLVLVLVVGAHHCLDDEQGLLTLALFLQVWWVNADRHVLRS